MFPLVVDKEPREIELPAALLDGKIQILAVNKGVDL